MYATPLNPNHNKPKCNLPRRFSLFGLSVFLLLLFTGVSPFFGIHHTLSKDFKHRMAGHHMSSTYHANSGKVERSAALFLEVAEEDDIPEEYQIQDLHQKNFSQHEWGYASFINALYQRLSSSFQRQSEEPIFVLNHSWRSHIS